MRERETSTDSFLPLSENKQRGDDIDEDRHYDETNDITLLKRFKHEYPKLYEELIKRLEISLKSKESENS